MPNTPITDLVNDNPPVIHPTEYTWEGHMNLLREHELMTKDIEATLTAGTDFLDFKGLFIQLQFPRSKILRIKRAGFYPWCWGGICLEHSVNEHPKFVYFGAHHISSKIIMTNLQAIGYKVRI